MPGNDDTELGDPLTQTFNPICVAVGSRSSAKSGAATLTLKTSSGHLFYRTVRATCAHLASLPDTGKPDVDVEACVLSIVIGSAAWVEASGNEVFSICAETPNIHTFETLRKDRIPVAAFIWDNFRLEPNGVRKWELLTNALAEIELDPKHPAVAEMNLLTRLRNRCIHAKPSHWPARDKGDIDLEKALKDKFVPTASRVAASSSLTQCSVEAVRLGRRKRRRNS